MKFYLKTEYIELCKLLKAANIVTSGAEAKELISSGEVYINEKIETRKRYKVRAGEKIKYNEFNISIYPCD